MWVAILSLRITGVSSEFWQLRETAQERYDQAIANMQPFAS